MQMMTIQEIYTAISVVAQTTERISSEIRALRGLIKEAAQSIERLEHAQKLFANSPPDLIQITVDDLELTVRTRNCLRAARIDLLVELLSKTEADLLNIPNMGKKSVNEVKAVLEYRGLHLGSLSGKGDSND